MEESELKDSGEPAREDAQVKDILQIFAGEVYDIEVALKGGFTAKIRKRDFIE